MPGAARISDTHVCPMGGGPVQSGGEGSVLIDGQPAAVVGSMCVCAGPPDRITGGSSTVFFNGKPAARQGDSTSSGGTITSGSATVIIGG